MDHHHLMYLCSKCCCWISMPKGVLRLLVGGLKCSAKPYCCFAFETMVRCLEAGLRVAVLGPTAHRGQPCPKCVPPGTCLLTKFCQEEH